MKYNINKNLLNKVYFSIHDINELIPFIKESRIRKYFQTEFITPAKEKLYTRNLVAKGIIQLLNAKNLTQEQVNFLKEIYQLLTNEYLIDPNKALTTSERILNNKNKQQRNKIKRIQEQQEAQENKKKGKEILKRFGLYKGDID